MALFDAYLMVDWSAAARPVAGADSIWWALLRRGTGGGDGGDSGDNGGARLTARENPRTRAAATERIGAVLAELLAAGARTLVGFDFPFGYPAGTARRLGLRGLPWRHMWQKLSDMIEDGPDNRNNRIDVAERLNERLGGEPFPFWGNVREETRRFLLRRGRRPHGPDDPGEWRLCDRRARTTSSVWQLAGAGSVGSQALTGIPCVWRLRTDPRLAMDSALWPFETGLAYDPRPRIVLAEVYPSLVAPAPESGLETVKDARQVRAIAAHFATLDDAGALAASFAGDAALTVAERAVVEGEESWILGA